VVAVKEPGTTEAQTNVCPAERVTQLCSGYIDFTSDGYIHRTGIGIRRDALRREVVMGGATAGLRKSCS
jgi:hypothetical protein